MELLLRLSLEVLLNMDSGSDIVAIGNGLRLFSFNIIGNLKKLFWDTAYSRYFAVRGSYYLCIFLIYFGKPFTHSFDPRRSAPLPSTQSRSVEGRPALDCHVCSRRWLSLSLPDFYFFFP